MKNFKISDYFEGAAAKYLSVVDLDPTREDAGERASHQHEVGGLPSAGAKAWLGTSDSGEKLRFSCTYLLLSDETEKLDSYEGEVTWYDTRWGKSGRSPEYRLFYRSNPITRAMQAGDFLLIAKHRDGNLLFFIAPPQSTYEMQLRSLFGVGEVTDRFTSANLELDSIPLPLRIVLEDLGIDLSMAQNDDGYWLDKISENFGLNKFPSTSIFSNFARESLLDSLSPQSNPDDSLMAWMNHEERLFRLLEREILKDRLKQGFGENGEDVDEFISFSLSVQNRRKSRVGYAFESHLGHLFSIHKLKFEKGGKFRFTENNSRPDFLFPDFSSYHNLEFPEQKLFLLGAKTTCKDRWRQVLSEGKRIKVKHLATIEAAISSTQTDEMSSNGIQLVIPESIHQTFTESQKMNLLSLSEFINLVSATQQ